MLPGRIRNAPGMAALRRAVRRLVRRTASEADLYDRAYYRQIDKDAGSSFAVMAEGITRVFQPRTVVDVGCGSGALLAELQRRGARVLGLERSPSGLKLCAARGVEARSFDVERDVLAPSLRFDVAVSFEVAEHLRESSASWFVEFLCRLSPIVLLTAATPGQGGHGHINEQPHEYWIDRFAARGHHLDRRTTEYLRRRWDEASVAPWFAENVMVFRARSAEAEVGSPGNPAVPNCQS